MADQKEFINELLEHIRENSGKIEYNAHMLEITEGDLKKHIRIALVQQLSPENVNSAMHRCAPINIWRKIVNKLSKLYSIAPERKTENPADQELIDYYTKRGVDKTFGSLNNNYNNYKWSTVEIFEDERQECLRFRTLPSNVFLPFSNDKIDPMRVTAMIKFMGMHKDKNGALRSKYWAYTEDGYTAFLDNGDMVWDDMVENDGGNPFGVIPFEYINVSDNFLIPTPDQDTYQMSVTIPVLITDQNFASMFMSIPIVYTTNVDADKLPQTPNAQWALQAADPEKPVTVGVVKADPDLNSQMNNVRAQLSMWLETRDIKPGTVGSLNAENFASGLAKIISEMDTLENRNEQKPVFEEFERNFWRRLATMHNKLVESGRSKDRRKFSDPETLVVDVIFAEAAIVESRSDKVLRLKEEVLAGLASKRSAIKQLNPQMTDEDIEEEIAMIDNERTTVIINDSEEANEQVD